MENDIHTSSLTLLHKKVYPQAQLLVKSVTTCV